MINDILQFKRANNIDKILFASIVRAKSSVVHMNGLLDADFCGKSFYRVSFSA